MINVPRWRTQASCLASERWRASAAQCRRGQSWARRASSVSRCPLAAPRRSRCIYLWRQFVTSTHIIIIIIIISYLIIIIIIRMIFIVLSSWPQAIATVHSVHLVNVEQCQAAVDPQTKPRDLGCESACRLLSSTTNIAIYYYYSARKLILIYHPT